MATLEQILGTIAVEVEHQEIEFRLVPFTNSEVMAWNRTLFAPEVEGETPIARNERVQGEQLALIAAKMKACVVGSTGSRKVTPEWVAKEFPQTVLQDLAEFFANGQRPTWAGDSGN